MTVTVAPGPTTESAVSPWHGFQTGLWLNEINVRDFIQQNYTPYDGDESFLAPATARTKKIWDILTTLFVEARTAGSYGLPVYVTENGIADAADQYRPLYVVQHLTALEQVIAHFILPQTCPQGSFYRAYQAFRTDWSFYKRHVSQEAKSAQPGGRDSGAGS